MAMGGVRSRRPSMYDSFTRPCQPCPYGGMPSEPPSPDGLPLVGNTAGFIDDRFQFIRDARRDYGDVFMTELLGLGEVCYLTHPDEFERVLATDREAFDKSEVFRVALGDGLLSVNGEQWETQRALLGEFFYPERIRSYAGTMVAATERRIDRWTAGETRSLLEEMTALTLEIIFETLLDRRLYPGEDPALREAVAGLNSYFTPASLALPQWVPVPARRRFRRHRATLRTELRGLLADRADPDRRGDDLLSLLAGLRASDEAPMSEQEIVDQLVTFLFAGHETTALALTYTLYELGSAPPVRRAFHEELDAVLEGDRPTRGTVADLTVTERVVREALRLYPPAHTIPRITTRDVELGGYHLPEGTQTHLALHSVHRDGRFYSEPSTFRPDRWHEASPESKGYAYVPFGAGPRTCIGRQFALLEAHLVLATIGRRYRLDPEEPLELAPRMSTQPAGDVPVTVRERTERTTGRPGSPRR